MTLLRLWGERSGFSARLFATEAQGIFPTGVSWLVGISWLPLPFGAFFAWKLLRAGERPRGSGLSVFRYGVLGAIFAVAALRFLVPAIAMPLHARLLVIWLVMVISAAIAWRAWPALGRVLLAYGYAARVPVAIVMLLAMRGNWGTHYDYAGFDTVQAMPLLSRYLWLGFFPQLVFWVAFTIVLGFIGGGLLAAVAFKNPRPRP